MGFELIHADGDFCEIEELTAFSRFDAELSLDDGGSNDWMLELPEQLWEKSPVLEGHYIYIDGTEWGGPAERVSHIGKDGVVRVYGTCWRGLLARRIICPPDGETHLVISEQDANAALEQLIGDWGGGLFEVSNADSGLVCSAALRFRTLLESANILLGGDGRLDISYSRGCVLLACLPVRDLSEQIELSQDYDAVITSERALSLYNHIIALGGGEMLDRTVTELWLLPDGTVTDDSSAEGVPSDEQLSTLLYDYSGAGSDDDLRNAAARKLRAAKGSDTMDIELFDYDSSLGLTDRVSVRDNTTGMAATLQVSNMLLKLDHSGFSLRHRLSAVL